MLIVVQTREASSEEPTHHTSDGASPQQRMPLLHSNNDPVQPKYTTDIFFIKLIFEIILHLNIFLTENLLMALELFTFFAGQL